MPEHETREFPARVPLLAMLATAAFVLLAAVGIGALMLGAWQASRAPDESPARTVETQLVEPALQIDPSAELEAFERSKRRHLDGVGWVDREAGVVHMPIDRAMTLLVERGSVANDVFERPAADSGDEPRPEPGEAPQR